MWSSPNKCTVLVTTPPSYGGTLTGVYSQPHYSTDEIVSIDVDIKNTGNTAETYDLHLVVYDKYDIVAANGTIFIIVQTDKLIYSDSESVTVNLSVKDVAFNATNATLNMTLTDPKGNKTYFDITGSNGNYSTIISQDKKSGNGTYNILVKGTKEDYMVYSDQTFFIVNERTKLRSDIPRIIKLNTTDTLTIFVKTDTNQSVKDAFVTLNGCGFNETRKTEENGFVVFNTSFMNKTGVCNTTKNTSEPIINHTYTSLGNYTVNLTVTDNSGSSNTTSRIIAVSSVDTIPPNITSWSNNKTNNDSLKVTINVSEGIFFNANADQEVNWNWYKDGVNQSHNYDNFTTSWNGSGNYTVRVNASNANGSDTVTWKIKVLSTININVQEGWNMISFPFDVQAHNMLWTDTSRNQSEIPMNSTVFAQ